MRHLNRKNICNPILEDISIEEVKKHYGFIHSTPNPPKSTKITPKSTKSSTKNFHQKNTKIHQNAKFHPPKSTKIHQN